MFTGSDRILLAMIKVHVHDIVLQHTIVCPRGIYIYSKRMCCVMIQACMSVCSFWEFYLTKVARCVFIHGLCFEKRLL